MQYFFFRSVSLFESQYVRIIITKFELLPGCGQKTRILVIHCYIYIALDKLCNITNLQLCAHAYDVLYSVHKWQNFMIIFRMLYH